MPVDNPLTLHLLYANREKRREQVRCRRNETPPLPPLLELVLILGMDYGLVLFTSDRGITPAAAAKLADDHGFQTFYVPEHTHIPVKREAAHPAPVTNPARRPLHADPGPVGEPGHRAAVTSRVRLSTAVALPVEHDPITLAKSIATLTICQVDG